MVKHFKTTKERLAYVRGDLTEIKPIKAKKSVPQKKPEIDLDAMNKTELIEFAIAKGIPIKVKDTKANILAAIKENS